MPLPISYLLAIKLAVKPANQEEVEGGHRAGDAFWRLWNAECNRPVSVFLLDSSKSPPHREPRGRRRAAGRYQGVQSRGSAVSPGGSGAARASGRGGAGRGSQTAAPANLASITLPDLGLQGAGGAQPGLESGGTDGLSGSASSEGAAAVALSGWKAAAAISLCAPGPLLPC